jgi:chitinase
MPASTRAHPRIRPLLPALVLVAVVFAALAPIRPAEGRVRFQPVVTVAAQAVVGESIAVSGWGFPRNSRGAVSIGGTNETWFRTNQVGRFSTTATVPPVPAGPVAVTVTVAGVTASTMMEVVIPPPNGSGGEPPVTEATPATAAPSVPAPSRRVVGYFPIWVRNAGYTGSAVDFSVVDVVAHFSVVPRSDGSLEIPDWGPFPDPSLITAAHRAGAKVVLVVGGDHEASTRGFSSMASRDDTRQRFVRELVELVRTHGYDGVDIDWEFPESTSDRANLTTLIRDLRAALPVGASLSLAAPASDWYGQWFDLQALTPHLDWIGAMSYSLHAPGWSGHSGHNAALFSPAGDAAFHWHASDNLSLDSVQRYYLSRGVPREKLLLGIPFYGHRFDGATDIHRGLTSTAGGAMTYAEIAPLVGAGWTRHHDREAQVPYLVRNGAPGVISYDDAESVRAKCAYVAGRELGGVIVWHLGGDNGPQGQPLLEAVRACRPATG